MTAITLFLDDTTYRFYQRIAHSTSQSTQQVLSDALFKLAGELSLEAIKKAETHSTVEMVE